MARTVTITINGSDFHMPANYAVSREIAEMVGDPLKMTINNAEYGPANWDTENVIDIIYIGLKHADCALTRDAVAEAIVSDDLVKHMQIAATYIATMVTGTPEKPASGQKKAANRNRGSK